MPGPMKNPDPLVYTPATAAEYLAMSERQVRDAVTRRELTHVKAGRSLRFRRSDLEQYIEARTVKAL